MAQWHAKRTGSYSKSSAEGWDNVQLIYSYLVRHGFTDAAACGVIANSVHEGGLNPWRWESDDVLATTDYNIIDSSMIHGYGLCGWTPSGKYLHDNWSNLGLYPSQYKGYAPNYSDQPGAASDGHAQCVFIVEGQRYNWVTQGTGRVNVTWQAYRTITDPQTAAEVWCRDYEYPANLEQEVQERRQEVLWFWERLEGTTPVPDPVENMGASLILILKKIADRSRGIL